jgi:hypothetical protein
MVRRDHTLDKDANKETQKGQKGEKECKHVQTLARQAWAPARRPHGRMQLSHCGRPHPTSVGSPMANHADDGRVERVPDQTLLPDSAPVASHLPLSATPIVVLKPLFALKIIVRPATMGRLALITAATGPGCLGGVTAR